MVGLAGFGLAAWLGRHSDLAVGNYEYFLFLLGSVFVPLFGVFVADYFVLRRGGRGGVRVPAPEGQGSARLNLAAVLAWVAGFFVYQWSVPTPLTGWQDALETFFHGWLHLPFPLWNSAAGASIPSFAMAMALHIAVSTLRASRRPRPAFSP